MALNLVLVTERDGTKRKLPPLPLHGEKPVYSESGAGSLPFVPAYEEIVKIRLEYCDVGDANDKDEKLRKELEKWIKKNNENSLEISEEKRKSINKNLDVSFAVSTTTDTNSEVEKNEFSLKIANVVPKKDDDESDRLEQINFYIIKNSKQLFTRPSEFSYVSITINDNDKDIKLYSCSFTCIASNKIVLVPELSYEESVLLPLVGKPPVYLESGTVGVPSVSVDSKYAKICLEFCDKANDDDKELREKLEEWLKGQNNGNLNNINNNLKKINYELYASNQAVSFAVNSIAVTKKKTKGQDTEEEQSKDDKTVNLKIARVNTKRCEGENEKSVQREEIEFYIDTKDDQIKRLFGQLSGFSYVSITIKNETFFSGLFACSYPAAEKNNIEGIISEVANNYLRIAVKNPKRLNKTDKMSLNLARLESKTPTSYKELNSLLWLFKRVAETYRKYLKYLKIKPAHKIEKESVPVPFYCVKNINIRDTLKKDLRFFTANNSGVGPKYLPVFVHGEVKKKSLDTYENTTILKFLVTVADSVDSLKKMLGEPTGADKPESEPPYTVRVRQNEAGEVCPVYAEIISPQLSSEMDKYSKELNMLINEYSKLFHSYGIGKLDYMPRSTKIFQEVHPYNEFFEIMVQWFRDGTAVKNNLEKISLLAQTKSMDKLFEYYCLLKLKEMLEGHGYEFDPKETLSYSYGKEKAKSDKYIEEIEIYNTFKFKHKDDNALSVVLYYRPYIPMSSASNDNNDGKNSRNELGLYRSMTSWGNEYKYFEPDFVLKFSKDSKDVYVILDPKFSVQYNIINFNLFEDIVLKYALGLEDVNKQSSRFPYPVMVWALQGRSNKDRNKGNMPDTTYKFYGDRQNDMPFSFGIQPFTPGDFDKSEKPTDTLWIEIKSCLERCWQ